MSHLDDATRLRASARRVYELTRDAYNVSPTPNRWAERASEVTL